MQRVLVVDNDASTCGLIEDAFRKIGIGVTSALTGNVGADMLVSRTFELALISVKLPEYFSALALAELAAEENTPFLLISDHSTLTKKLTQFDLPYLRKPLNLESLITQSRRVMAENHDAVQRLKDAMTKMITNTKGVERDMRESRRLIDDSRRLLGGEKGRSRET